MIEGLRRAQEGMLPRISQQESLANNLANALTPGFKRDRVSFEAKLQAAASSGTPPELPGGPSYTLAARSQPDLRPGAMQQTGNPLDLALSPGAFFVVQTPEGARYTRAGSFVLNAAGELTLPDGARVLGQNGPIRIDGAPAFSPDGSLSVDGQFRDRLRLVKFDSADGLSHQGSFLWSSSKPALPARGATVTQGFVEGSNVNPVEEMIEMMSAFRSYEANLRSAQIQGDSLGQLINNVGRGK